MAAIMNKSTHLDILAPSRDNSADSGQEDGGSREFEFLNSNLISILNLQYGTIIGMVTFLEFFSTIEHNNLRILFICEVPKKLHLVYQQMEFKHFVCMIPLNIMYKIIFKLTTSF
jgi:hypothetical protein